MFEVSMVAINGLSSVLQRLTGTMTTIENRQAGTGSFDMEENSQRGKEEGREMAREGKNQGRGTEE